jgi:hypothetical protein
LVTWACALTIGIGLLIALWGYRETTVAPFARTGIRGASHPEVVLQENVKTKSALDVPVHLERENSLGQDMIAGVGGFVRVTGELHHPVVAFGGETTGTEIETRSHTYELDLKGDPNLMSRLEPLDGKTVEVSGIQSVRRGVEIPERRIIQVISLRPVE